MYEIELPVGGCSVYHGDYVDHYNNNVRTRYYFSGNRLVQSTRSSYTRIPDGATCLSQGDLIYKPETEVYFNVISIICAIFIFVFAVRLILYPFWRKIR